jgi:hypothetical protein
MCNRPENQDPAAAIPIVETLGMDQVRLIVEMLAELDNDEAAQRVLKQLGERCDADTESPSGIEPPASPAPPV